VLLLIPECCATGSQFAIGSTLRNIELYAVQERWGLSTKAVRCTISFDPQGQRNHRSAPTNSGVPLLRHSVAYPEMRKYNDTVEP